MAAVLVEPTLSMVVTEYEIRTVLHSCIDALKGQHQRFESATQCLRRVSYTVKETARFTKLRTAPRAHWGNSASPPLHFVAFVRRFASPTMDRVTRSHLHTAEICAALFKQPKNHSSTR
jgi:hypothetical protein